jgi:deoxyribose-phosphate aldolase
MESQHSVNNKYIDFTLLNPTANSKELKNAARVAVKYECAGLCIQANSISVVKNILAGTNVRLIVVPNWFEGGGIRPGKEYILDFCKEADEVDYIIDVYNMYELKKWDKVAEDIAKVKSYSKILKVIIEVYYLRIMHFEERIKLMKQAIDISVKNGADWIKSDSGLYQRTERRIKVSDSMSLTETAEEGLLDDTKNILKHTRLPVKIAGGVRTKELVEKLVKLGVKRIGASSFEVIND